MFPSASPSTTLHTRQFHLFWKKWNTLTKCHISSFTLPRNVILTILFTIFTPKFQFSLHWTQHVCVEGFGLVLYFIKIIIIPMIGGVWGNWEESFMQIVLRKNKVFVHPKVSVLTHCLTSEPSLPQGTFSPASDDSGDREKKRGRKGPWRHLSDNQDATGSSLPGKLEQVTNAGLAITDCDLRLFSGPGLLSIWDTIGLHLHGSFPLGNVSNCWDTI